jgi:hypothetical protein
MQLADMLEVGLFPHPDMLPLIRVRITWGSKSTLSQSTL